MIYNSEDRRSHIKENPRTLAGYTRFATLYIQDKTIIMEGAISFKLFKDITEKLFPDNLLDKFSFDPTIWHDKSGPYQAVVVYTEKQKVKIVPEFETLPWSDVAYFETSQLRIEILIMQSL